MNKAHAAMRERIRVEQPVATIDSLGGRAITWQEVATIWANVKTDSYQAGRETFEAGTLKSRLRYRMAVRHETALSEDMRIVWRGSYFNIRAIIERPHPAGLLEIIVEQEVES
jgi:SPP1 family predicted phage head-tail adaptor